MLEEQQEERKKKKKKKKKKKTGSLLKYLLVVDWTRKGLRASGVATKQLPAVAVVLATKIYR